MKIDFNGKELEEFKKYLKDKLEKTLSVHNLTLNKFKELITIVNIVGKLGGFNGIGTI